MESSIQVAQMIAAMQVSTMYAVVTLISVGAIVTGIAFAYLGSRFLESCARQPEIMSELQVQLFILAGLIDAVTMIGVAVALLFTFANPFVSALSAYLPVV